MSKFEGLQDTFTIGTTPKRIMPSEGNRLFVKIKNNSATVIYLGTKETVTSSDGYPLGDGVDFTLGINEGYNGEIWAVTAAGTSDVRIMCA